MVASDDHAFPVFSKTDPKTVVQRHRLINRADFVVTVRTPSEDFQSEIDFGERAKWERVFQGREEGGTAAPAPASAVPTIWSYFREQRFRAFSKGRGLSLSAH